MENKKLTDEELHDLVRHNLKNLDVTFQQVDWEQMQTRLRKERRKKWLFYSLSAFLMFLATFGTRYYFNLSKETANQFVEISASKAQATKDSTYSKNKVDSMILGKATHKQTFTPSFKEENPLSNEVILKTEQVQTDSQCVTTKNVQLIPQKQDNSKTVPLIEEIDSTELFVEKMLRKNIESNFINQDSTVFKALQRNMRAWKNAVIICDWTSSMYEYGSQILVLLNQFQEQNNVKGFVFFNDCDSTGKQSMNNNGKYFYTTNSNLESVIKQMKKAVRYGKGNIDYPENDLGAVLFAITQFPDAEHFILIADNKSTVKDVFLMGRIKRPLHIILCGETYFESQPIQPDYLTISKRVKASLHTIENDIPNVTKLKEKSLIRIKNTIWKYKDGVFKRSN